ncbi:MAG: hypothetical protein GYB67_17900 [Chloroflexi bacterium]|nr:hypothetical protein [Chloroflexota bacterium]
MLRLVFIACALVLSFSGAHGQDLMVPCFWRATTLSQPWISPDMPCLEAVIDDPSAGELAFTALAVAAEGTLYAARPLAGQIIALDDADGDGLPETPRIAADGLTLPNALTVHNGALYIAGGAHIYRLSGGDLTVLVDDLPVGGGFWTGGIAVGPLEQTDARIYVGVGAPCAACTPEDSERGTILSFALDGTDRRVLAAGLRQPADLAWHNGALWVVDSAPPARNSDDDQADLDELNRVTPDAHFGWPYCLGAGNHQHLPGMDCAEAAAPTLTFPTGSTPLGITGYRSDAIPALDGALLVALGGSYNTRDLRGYVVVAVTVDSATGAARYRPILPAWPEPRPPEFTLAEINYRGSGVWPHRPYDVAASPEGWVYISVGGGRILALRPNAPAEGQ